MDLRQLRTLVHIVELKSFTGAAQRLRIAQPALGLQIRKLEEELGVQLLVRHSRGVDPTEAGQILYEHAVNLLNDAEKAKQAAMAARSGRRSRVSVGMTPSAAHLVAEPFIARCAAELPEVQLALLEDLSSVLIEWIATDRMDMALGDSEVWPSKLDVAPLYREGFVMLGPVGALPDLKSHITQSQVFDLDLILPAQPHGARRRLEAAAAEAGRVLRVVLEVQSSTLLTALLRQGLGFTILPAVVASRMAAQEGFVLLPIVEPEMIRTQSLITSPRRAYSPTEKAVMALLCEVAVERAALPAFPVSPLAEETGTG